MGEKQQWSNEHLKCLLETCIEEVNKVGRKGLSLHKDSWVKLGSVLKERFGMELTQKQMKNAYDNLKAKYVGWAYLRNKTGNIYNPQTNTFTLTPDGWEEFRKGHPKAAGLKTHPLPYPNLCQALFDGNTASGSLKWTSTQTTSGAGSSSYTRVQTLQLTDMSFNDKNDDDDDGSSHHSGDSSPNNFADPPPTATTDKSPHTSRNDDRPSKRAKTSKPSITFDELAVDMQKALQHLANGPTVKECHEKMKLVGMDKTDPLFIIAFSIFGVSPNTREAFMDLPNEIAERLRDEIAERLMNNMA